NRLTRRVALGIASCFILTLLPLSAGAQGVIKKGAHAVQKGVETGVEKTKEGVEATGRENKKVITGEDTSEQRMKSTQASHTTTQEQTSPPTTPTAPAQRTTRPATRPTETRSAGRANKRLPATAGEFSLLLLVGGFALAGFGTLKAIRAVS